MSLIDRCRDRWADLHPFWHIVLVAVLLAALALADVAGWHKGLCRAQSAAWQVRLQYHA